MQHEHAGIRGTGPEFDTPMRVRQDRPGTSPVSANHEETYQPTLKAYGASRLSANGAETYQPRLKAWGKGLFGLRRAEGPAQGSNGREIPVYPQTESAGWALPAAFGRKNREGDDTAGRSWDNDVSGFQPSPII